MVIACDTSFLFSLYGNDAHSAKAAAWLSRRGLPLTLSPVNVFELGNALRFAEFKKFLTEGSAARSLALFDAAITQKRLMVETCNLADVFDEARRLSATHTISQGHRSFDILHVAAALSLKADTFLTFEINQKKLAVSEGLSVPL